MSETLPKPLRDYFGANLTFDVAGMLAAFAPDAIVHDERQSHQGTQAIRQWIETATVGNRAIATPQEIQAEGDKYLVKAEVAGSFPGSPVSLMFRFRLKDGSIAELEIG